MYSIVKAYIIVNNSTLKDGCDYDDEMYFRESYF